jgi:hypothetical protein
MPKRKAEENHEEVPLTKKRRSVKETFSDSIQTMMGWIRMPFFLISNAVNSYLQGWREPYLFRCLDDKYSLRFMITAGANVNVTDKHGYTPTAIKLRV